MPWFWDLVAISSPDPLVPAQPAQSADSAIQSDSTQESVEPKSPYLAPRALAIKEQGFCEAVETQIEVLKESIPD